MSDTSSSVSELSEEVLHAFEGILSDNDADDKLKGSEIRMDGLYHDDQKNIGTIENLGGAVVCPLKLLCQQQLLNMEKKQSSLHPLQSENDYESSSDKIDKENRFKSSCSLEHAAVCELKSPHHNGKTKSDLHPIQSDSEDLDFSADNSVDDPNYQGISDSDESTGTPAAKKFKRNISKNNLKNDVNAQHDNVPSTILLSPIATAIQVEVSTPSNATFAIVDTPPSRKRKRNEASWGRNVRNNSRQKGKSYVDVNGIVRPARSVKQIECSCVFRCSSSFDAVQRQNIHDAFWKLDDKSKNFYYAQFVKKMPAKRKSKKDPLKKREFTYNYFLNCDERHARVCKQFFLNTLDISSRRLQWFFSNKLDESTGIPYSPAKGKHIKNKTPSTKIEEIKEHIKSFPRMESHYCRKNTKKEYLGSNLSIQKMYNLYKESCNGTPVKQHIYSKVFNEEFNCAFHLPKKDQCDQCALFKNKVDLDNAEQIKFFNHEKNKMYAKKERDNDRKNRDDTTAIITYDLENLPCQKLKFQASIIRVNLRFII